MKKFLIFLTAIAMLGLVSCQSDKPRNPNDTAISEPVEEIPTEPVFREYSQSDFKEINVALNKIDGEPPVKITEVDLSELLTEKLIAPCKLPENRESFKEDIPDFYNAGNFDEICDTAFGGSVRYMELDGDVIYMLMDYDVMCYYSHCHKIFAYDTKTETLDEVYSYSSAENGEYLSQIFAFGGELYVIKEIKFGKNELCRLENGSLTTLLTADDLPSESNSFWFCENAYNRFLLASYELLDGVYYANSLYEYDPENDSLTELFYSDDEIHRELVVFLENEIISSERDDDGNTCIAGENFRINTGIKGGIPITAGGNRISVQVTDSIQSRLYTYDLDKMECYTSDISDRKYGSFMSVGKHIVIGSSMSNMTDGDISFTLIMPDIGAVFTYSKTHYDTRDMNFLSGYDGGRLWTAEFTYSGVLQSTDEKGIRTYELQEWKLGKFIIIETEE